MTTCSATLMLLQYLTSATVISRPITIYYFSPRSADVDPQTTFVDAMGAGDCARAIGLVVLQAPLVGAESPVVIAPPALDNPKAAEAPQAAVLAGGCFWGMQGVFEHVRGVQKVVAGCAGGDRSTAQYDTVSSGTTGHAESVEITFDPAQVSY